MSLIADLESRGVIIHCPAATVVDDVDPARFEAGVEIFPGTTIVGRESLFGAGTRLGKAGGGYFRDVRAGRGVDLYGGMFDDSVFLDGVVVRGHAEMRGGTLMEEASEAAHHVGYKMTIMFPQVVAGSLVNFCDALVAGGTSRADHSEIGSCLALYNFTPWGDKFASLFGDVPAGVFLRSPRIFVGGQTQVVSPITVGFGAVIPAGCSVRRDVPAGRIYGDAAASYDGELDTSLYGALAPKLEATFRFVGNLRALEVWYRKVRIPMVESVPLRRLLYEAALQQVEAGIEERLKRLNKLMGRLPASAEQHAARAGEARAAGDEPLAARHEGRLAEHERIMASWPEWSEALGRSSPSPDEPFTAIVARWHKLRAGGQRSGYVRFISDALNDAEVSPAREALSAIVARYTDLLVG